MSAEQDDAQERMRALLAKRCAGTKRLTWVKVDDYHLDGGTTHRVARTWLHASGRWVYESWRRTTEQQFGQMLAIHDDEAAAKKRCEDDAGTHG